LAILVQQSKENQAHFAKIGGFEHMLIALAVTIVTSVSIFTLVQPYSETNPGSIEEEEMVENLFDVICAALTLPDNQPVFQASEGMDLMLLMIKYNSDYIYTH
jgi:hypothetical protein